MSRLDREKLKLALLDAVAEAWTAFKLEYPSDRVYGVGLYTADLAEYIGLTVFSEEGLARVAAEYAARSGRGPDDEKTLLRWSPCDSPYHLWREGLFRKAQEILDSAPDPYDDETDIEDRVDGAFSVLVDVLRTLDSSRTFGADRNGMVLSIWMGDQSDEDRIDYGRRLNPPEIAKRFEEELCAGSESFLCQSRAGTGPSTGTS